MRTENNNRYIVREVFRDKSCDILPRETLFTSSVEADDFAFRRADFLGDNWQVFVCRLRIFERSIIFNDIKAITGCKI